MRKFYLLIIVLLTLSCYKEGFAAPVGHASTRSNDRKKILVIKVIEPGLVTVGWDTLSTADLPWYIQDRLFKSYKGTGKMYDQIKLEKADNNLAEMVMEGVKKGIQEGQQRALTELCLLKYKHRFSDLDAGKQERLKKQFPVLFQSGFE